MSSIQLPARNACTYHPSIFEGLSCTAGVTNQVALEAHMSSQQACSKNSSLVMGHCDILVML